MNEENYNNIDEAQINILNYVNQVLKLQNKSLNDINISNDINNISDITNQNADNNISYLTLMEKSFNVIEKTDLYQELSHDTAALYLFGLMITISLMTMFTFVFKFLIWPWLSTLLFYLFYPITKPVQNYFINKTDKKTRKNRLKKKIDNYEL